MQHQASRRKMYQSTKSKKRDGFNKVRLFFSKQTGLVLLLAVMIVSTVTNTGVGVFLGSNVSAQSADAQERAKISAAWKARPVDEQIKIYQTYLALQSCFAGGLMKDGSDNRINPVNASKFQWFNEIAVGAKANFTFIGDNIKNNPVDVLGVKVPGSLVVCSSSSTIKTMLTTLGEKVDGDSSGGELACELGFDRNKKGGRDGAGDGCASDSPEGDFYRKGTIDSQVNKLRIRYENRFWGQGPYLTEPAQYHRYKTLFDTCASPNSDKTLKGTDRSYEIYTIGEDGKVSEEKQFYYGKENGGKARSDTTATAGGVGVMNGWKVLNPVSTLTYMYDFLPSSLPSSIANDKTIATKLTCAQLEDKLNDKSLAEKYAAYLQVAGAPPTLTPEDGADECASNPSAEGCEERSSCVIDGIGWIVCPVVIFLAGVSDAAYGFLADNFLATPVGFFDTSQPTFKAWQGFLSVANVLLVIAFLVIVFSQLTGAGISNYGVKKMLPRLIIVAIMMNLSFFICQLAVDVSNILGYSTKSLLSSMGTGTILLPVTNEQGAVDTAEGGLGFAGAAIAVLGGLAVGTAVTGGVTLALVALIGVLVTSVITLLVIFFILVIRQVLVVLLIVIAPLAFVAYLLPNTEQWFTRWRKLFTASLLLFPIIGVIFGASTLASKVITGLYAPTDNLIGQIVGAGVMILPLLVVPAVLKSALDLLGKFGGKVTQLGDKANAGARNRAGNLGFVKHAENMSAEKKARIATGTYVGAGGKKNPFNWSAYAKSGINRAANRNRGFNMLTTGYGAQRDLGAQAQERKDQQEAIAMFGADDELVEAWALSGGNIDSDAFRNLKHEGQKEQFKKMRAAGYHTKPTAHLAAVQYMSEQGKGTAEAVISALGHAQGGGASSVAVLGSYNSAIAAYRNSGRGDIMGKLEAEKKAVGTIPTDAKSPSATAAQIETERVKAWQGIAASKVHRMGVDEVENPEGHDTYKTYLHSNSEYTRRAVAGYDAMETRAQNEALGAIVSAAQAHQTANPMPGVGPVTDIASAKKYYDIS